MREQKADRFWFRGMASLWGPRVRWALVVAGLVVWGSGLGARATSGELDDEEPDLELFPAMVIFGDSTVDVGNNNYLKTIIKADFRPYGRDFDTHVPTGRFCNGRLVTDFIASLIGLPYPPPYLHPDARGPKLLKGVNFASAASGWLEETGRPFNVIGLQTQFTWFLNYKQEVISLAGPAKAQDILEGALYVIGTGSNDYANNYFLNPHAQKQFTYDQFQNLILGSVRQYILELYDEGARNIVVTSLPPLGCLPSQLSVYEHAAGRCIEEPHNRMARNFNSALRLTLESMKPSLHGSRLVYLDTFTYLYEVVQNPNAYGFVEASRGCCGAGHIEVSLLCNAASRSTCANASDYVFFDSFHPTDKFYGQLAQQFFEIGVPILTGPVQP